MQEYSQLTDPFLGTQQIKSRLNISPSLGKLKRKTTWMRVCIRLCILLVAFLPKFYGLPKIHKTGNPLRPIVSSRGYVTYSVTKVLCKVFKPLVGKSSNHIQSTGDFVSKAKGITLGECLTSYDVTSPFTSVPTDPALNIIKDLLEKDEKLNDRTVLSVKNITEHLGFCLHNTYFSFQNKKYEQVEGAAMGTPISPIVANLYMEHFERKALRSATNPPRCGTGLWMTHGSSNNKTINRHFWNISKALIQLIKFTVEGTQGNGAILFLDTLITLLADNSLSITVYCKPTHTDQYLQWDSHYSLSAKYGVIGTLTHRAKTVCTDLELLQRELQHLRKALGKCNYPPWANNKVQNILINSNWEDPSNNNLQSNGSISNNNLGHLTHTRDNNSKQTPTNNNQGASTTPTTTRPNSIVGQVVIPYTKGLVESFNHICGKYGIQVHFKGNTRIKQVLMKPKDQDPKEKKSRVIYSFQCNHIACNEEYIGETARTLGERCKEHLKQPSPIHAHIQQTGHSIIDTSLNIIDREGQRQARTIKESIFIRVNNPTLNQNIGKYNRSHIWDRVLFNTPGPKLHSSQQSSAQT